MWWLLLIPVSWAQETPQETTNPDIGIQVVPAGSILTLPSGEQQDVETKSFLLPERYYDNALIKARQLDVCLPALDACTERALGLQVKCAEQVGQCLDQFDVDDSITQALRAERDQWQTRALVAETALQDARRDKWVAWSVAGGLVLGATSVTVLTLSR